MSWGCFQNSGFYAVDEKTEIARLEAIRHQLCLLARRASARFLDFPRDWRPMQVRRPEPDEGYFTPDGAWEFIADRLEDGHPFRERALESNPGKTGYVMLVELGVDVRPLYIKVRLGAGKVFGISFHYSEFSESGSQQL